MRRSVGELERPGHVTRCKDVGVNGLQILVGGDGAVGENAQIFQPVAGEARHAAHGAQQGIKLDADLLPLVLDDDGFDITIDVSRFLAAQRLVTGEHLHAIGLQRGFGQRRHLFVFANHDARRHLHLRHLGAQALKTLRQLAANGATTQNHNAPGNVVQLHELIPQRVAGHIAHVVDAWQRWHKGLRPGGDDDGAGGQRLLAAIVQRNLHRPRVHNFGVALQHLHAQAGVALHAVVRLDRGDNGMNALHHRFEAESGLCVGQAVPRAVLHLVRQLGAFDECLAGHAAVVEAVTTHLVGFNQRDFGFNRSGNVGRHQPTGPTTDHHQIAVKTFGFDGVPSRIHLAPLHVVEHFFNHQR